MNLSGTYVFYAEQESVWKLLMDPNAIAQAMAKPALNQSTSSQQNFTVQLSSGLTIRQAQEMIAENNDRMFLRLSERLAGA